MIIITVIPLSPIFIILRQGSEVMIPHNISPTKFFEIDFLPAKTAKLFENKKKYLVHFAA